MFSHYSTKVPQNIQRHSSDLGVYSQRSGANNSLGAVSLQAHGRVQALEGRVSWRDRRQGMSGITCPHHHLVRCMDRSQSKPYPWD